MTNEKTEAPLSDMQARDRIATLLHYMRTLLTNASDDLETATAAVGDGATGSAALDGMCGLNMLGEYLDELAKLEERPFAVNGGN